MILCCCDNDCSAIVDKWTNTTVVENTELDADCNPVGGDTMPPYPRPSESCDAGSISQVTECFDAEDCSSNTPKCASAPLDLEACPTDSATTEHFPEAPAGVINCFEKSGGNVSYALCGRLGFKNVQAVAVWHGRKPFNSIADLTIRDRLSGQRDYHNYNVVDPDDVQDTDCAALVDGSVS